MRFRRALLTSHLIIGVLLAPVMVVLGLTGAILSLQPEIEDAANTLLTHLEPGSAPLPLRELTGRLQARYPGSRLTDVQYPGRPDRAISITLQRPDSDAVALIVNPYTGVVLGSADDLWELRPVHDLHTRLSNKDFGSEITAWTAVGLLFLALSGMVLWWPGKIFTIVRTGSARRILFHLHSALAAWSWLALLLFGLTGLVLHWQTEAYDLAATITTSAPLPDPGDSLATCSADSATGYDRLLQAAAAAQPGARITWIQDGRTAGAPVRVAMRYPEDRTPAGRTIVFLDPCSGAVRSMISTRTASPAYRLVRYWNREVHTGDVWGWPTRILATLFSLTLPLVAVTGPLLWWSRRKKATSER